MRLALKDYLVFVCDPAGCGVCRKGYLEMFLGGIWALRVHRMDRYGRQRIPGLVHTVPITQQPHLTGDLPAVMSVLSCLLNLKHLP